MHKFSISSAVAAGLKQMCPGLQIFNIYVGDWLTHKTMKVIYLNISLKWCHFKTSRYAPVPVGGSPPLYCSTQ